LTDIFVFAPVDGYDIIMDFAVGVDHLQFTAGPPNLSIAGVGADTVITSETT